MTRKSRLLHVGLVIVLALSPFKFFYANNLQITDVTVTGQDDVLNFKMIGFDLSWENSWRTSTLESNWDAAWIFVKYRLNEETIWSHATISTLGNIAPAGSTIDVPSDGTGAFIYNSADYIGSNLFTDVALKWQYGVDGLDDYDSVEICVLGIEMVLVPQGSFYAGDGTVSTIMGNFESGTSGTSFQITSEASITLGGGGAGSLGNNNCTGMQIGDVDDFNDSTPKTLPADFPKGYNAFYMMKYELSQFQYISFLNKLSFTQQATNVDPFSVPDDVPGTYAISNNYRDGTVIMTSGTDPTVPAIYASDLNANGVYNETEDGQAIPMRVYDWFCVESYLDWAALRPLTELEFEKSCRGSVVPVADEFAWGTTSFSSATGISNSGLPSETASNAGSNCVYNGSIGVVAPLRVGSFAQGASDRSSSGGTYYGAMEMSGNLFERIISVGSATGRAFTGLHGDGELDANGNAFVTGWPGIAADGSGYRGGTTIFSVLFLYVSNRKYANGTFASSGIRGGRTAP